MEQPFLPTEVSLLVLRYLASIGCKDTARCFFKEFPSLREFIQSKNRGGETPSGFEAPQVLGSLEDILYDYGRAKLIDISVFRLRFLLLLVIFELPALFTTRPPSLVKNLVVKLLSDWRALSEDSVSPCDTLATQLRQIGTLLGQTFSNDIRFSSSSRGSSTRLPLLPPPKSTRDADTQTVTVIRTKRITGTCTTLDIPESQNIVVMTVKKLCNGETQTDLVAEKELEPPSVQSDNGAEAIPYMFYNNLLNNTGLQEMIASNINQQFVGSGTQNEKEEVVKTVSSKTENEIDNFLAELLQGEENSQGGFSYSWNNDPAEFDEIELPNLGMPTQNENSSTLNTPAKASPVKEAQTQEVESLAEKVRAKSTPQSKSPGNAQKANSRSSLNTTTATVTLSPSSLSAWQRLGRRNIAPKIPVAPVVKTGTVRTSIPLVAAQPKHQPQGATPSITAHVQEVHVFAKKSLPDRNETFAPTPTVAKENQVEVSESGNIASSQAGTKFETMNFKEQVKRHDKLSPLMQRLMASAQKFRQATTFDLEKKSFSTPRKKKHVRNLLFTTPPNLSKQTNKASLNKSNLTQNYAKGDIDLSQSVPLTRKRKAESVADPKSRKCLDLSFEQPKPKRANANDVKVKEEPPVSTGSRKSTRNQQRISDHKDYSSTIESVIQQPLRNDTELVTQKNGKTCPLEAKPTETPSEKDTSSAVDPNQKNILIASKARGESTSKPTKISVTPPSPRKKKSKSKRKSRRSEEESALKAVADKAVPLGRPKSVSPLKKASPIFTNSNNKECSRVQTKQSTDLQVNSKLLNDHPCSSLKVSAAPAPGPSTILSKGALKEVGTISLRKAKSSGSSGLSYNIIPQLSTSFGCQKPDGPYQQTEPFVTAAARSSIEKSNELKFSQSARRVVAPLPSVPNLLSNDRIMPPPSRLPSNPSFQPPLPLNPPFQPPLPPNPPFQPPLPKSPEFVSPYPKPSRNKFSSQKHSQNQPQFIQPNSSQSNSSNSRSTTKFLVRPNAPQVNVTTYSGSHLQRAPPPLPPPRPSEPPPPPPSPLNRSDSIQCYPLPKSSPNNPADQSIATALSHGANILPSVTPVKIIEDEVPDEPFEPVVPSPARFLMNFGCSGWGDSSDTKITLNYENNGVFPTNLFLSTPIKIGIPRTPGRGTPSSDEKSRSSCSSIFDTPDVTIFKEQNCPGLGDLNTPVPKAESYVPPTPSIPSRETNASLSSNSNHQENCDVSSTSLDISRNNETIPSSSQAEVHKPSIVRQQEFVQFEVSGRTKKLTLSEQQTLFSLLEMREGVGSPKTKVSLETKVSSPKMDKDSMTKLLKMKKVDLDQFLSLVHGARK